MEWSFETKQCQFVTLSKLLLFPGNTRDTHLAYSTTSITVLAGVAAVLGSSGM